MAFGQPLYIPDIANLERLYARCIRRPQLNRRILFGGI